MLFLEMVNELQKSYEIAISDFDNQTLIFDVVLLTNSQVDWFSNTLYIGSVPQIDYPLELPIVILSPDCEDFENRLSPGSCWGIIKSESLNEIYYMAKEILYENLKFQAISFQVAQAVLESKNIVSLMNKVAALMGNALILIDSNMKVLAYSTIYEIMDPLWLENIKQGHYSYDFIKKVKFNSEMQSWSKTGEDNKTITLNGDLQPKLVSRITKNGHLVGGLIMIAHHTPIRSMHTKQLPQIAKLLYEFLCISTENEIYKSVYSSAIAHILSEDNENVSHDLLILNKSNFPSGMRVVIARFIVRSKNRFLKRSIGLEFERIFSKGYSFQYKNYIGILVPEISSDQRHALSELAILENINIGISWLFFDILDLKKYFHQSVASIKQAQLLGETNQVLDYTDYAFYHLLNQIWGKASLNTFCHPALIVLKDYDKNNSADFYRTLETFLSANKNLKETAEILNLHRNSLTYRIARIRDLTNLDFNDNNTVFSLMYSFRLVNYLESSEIFNLQ